MASTRPPPLQIFEDSTSTVDASIYGVNGTNVEFPLSSPLDSIPSLPPTLSVFAPQTGVLAGPIPSEGGQSPLKHSRPSSSPPVRSILLDRTNISLPPPTAQPFTTDSPVKKPLPAPYHPIAPQQTRALFTTMPGFGLLQKEYTSSPYRSENIAEFPGPDRDANAARKTYNADHSSELCVDKKQQPEEAVPVHIPDPQDMPTVEDDGAKPPYSYASLIAMSILRAPNRRLTLAQIYKWISDSFSYYRTAETGWQNSIRHNLSLNKAFIKQERPKDDPGKGNYWLIEPGMEASFIKEKPSRRSAGPIRHQMQNSSDLQRSSSAGYADLRSEANLPHALPQDLNPAGLLPVQQLSAQHVAQSAPQLVPEQPSSDATIPASDPALLEDEAMPPPANTARLSSPARAMRSSPPVSDRVVSREASPCLGADLLSSRPSRSRKRKYNSMNDSGYFSSLDSSAMRPLTATGTERDSVAPRFKRGRAEEEIARIRSSSHDISPTKSRALLKQPIANPLSSSPFRLNDSALDLPAVNAPITPSVLFKKPRRPPPSASPNTNLRNHRNRIRELIGSPLKPFDDESTVFSPAFHIAEDDAFNGESSFTIYNDSPIKRKADSSPEKRSAKRPRFDRAQSIASALADITGMSNSITKPNPAIKPPYLGSPLRSRSPSKSPSKLMAISELSELGPHDLLNFDLLVEEEEQEQDELGSLDLLSGFQKIGEKENEVPTTKGKSSRNRPALGARSLTSQF